MNFLRMIKAVFFGFFSSPQLKSHLRFWVTPFDCDINWHLNNGSYLKLMDVGRIDYLLRAGFIRGFVKDAFGAAVVRVEIDFKKSVPPGTFITLDSEVIGRTEKSFIMRQVFHAGPKVVAEAKAIFVVTHKGRSVPTDKVISKLPEAIQKSFLQP